MMKGGRLRLGFHFRYEVPLSPEVGGGEEGASEVDYTIRKNHRQAVETNC